MQRLDLLEQKAKSRISFPQIIHFHVPKCGGTSLNAYLDFSVPAAQVIPLNFIKNYRDNFAQIHSGNDKASHETDEELCKNISFMTTYFWRVIHDHDFCVLPGLPDAYRFTVLRHPIARALSQIMDYRRTNHDDYITSDPITRFIIDMAKQKSLKNFIHETKDVEKGKVSFRNFMTSFLADGARWMYPTEQGSDREMAEHMLRNFDLVGTTENMDQIVFSLSAAMGLPPVTDIPRLNETFSSAIMDEVDDSLMDQLMEMNQDDLALYELANSLLSKTQTHTDYDVATFERHFDPERLPLPYIVSCEAIFDFNMQVVGSGFQGRDYPNDPRCAVWTGPGSVSVLYMRVPANQDIKVFFDHADYRHPQQREQLIIKCDDQVVQHSFENLENYRERITFHVNPSRPFIRIELIIPTPMTDHEAGLPSDDRKKKGICLKRYGYRQG